MKYFFLLYYRSQEIFVSGCVNYQRAMIKLSTMLLQTKFVPYLILVTRRDWQHQRLLQPYSHGEIVFGVGLIRNIAQWRILISWIPLVWVLNLKFPRLQFFLRSFNLNTNFRSRNFSQKTNKMLTQPYIVLKRLYIHDLETFFYSEINKICLDFTGQSLAMKYLELQGKVFILFLCCPRS